MATARVLELGCGTGLLWRDNLYQLPNAWRIYLSDLSMGMLQDARSQMHRFRKNFEYLQINAQDLPFSAESFDIVVANHMLYHIPDRDKALHEIHQVLKPEGRFLAATIGENHMQEIFSLGSRLVPNIQQQSEHRFNTKSFTLENGLRQIRTVFNKVTCDIYEDSLEVTESEHFLNYILSIADPDDPEITPDKINAFREYVDEIIAKQGSIHVSKMTGIFIGTK